VVGLKTIVVK